AVLGEHLLQRRGIVVRHPEALGLGQPHAVDDRSVVELVGVEAIGLVEDGGEEPFVGGPAGHVQDRVVGSEERRDLRLELLVELLRAADEPDGAEPRPPAVHGFLLRLPDAGVAGEAEVVVRGQHHDLAAADLHARALRRLEDELFLVGSGFAELGHLRGEVIGETQRPRLHVDYASERILPATRPPGNAASSAASASAKAAELPAMISTQSVGVRTNSMVPVTPRTTIESAGSSTTKSTPSISSRARDALRCAFSISSRLRHTPARPTTL